MFGAIKNKAKATRMATLIWKKIFCTRKVEKSEDLVRLRRTEVALDSFGSRTYHFRKRLAELSSELLGDYKCTECIEQRHYYH